MGDEMGRQCIPRACTERSALDVGNEHAWTGVVGAVLAIGVRGVYVASEQVGMTWILTNRRVISPAGLTHFAAAQGASSSAAFLRSATLEESARVALQHHSDLPQYQAAPRC